MNSTKNPADTLDQLSKLAVKYGADKWSRKHHYTPVYYDLFKKRRKSVKKVLEIGIGGEAASLKMWRDFFPNAHIYGADYRQEWLFKADRIDSILCDQRRKPHLLSLINQIGSDIDLVIDDGSHRPRDQVFSCMTLMPLLKKDAIYIIEDVVDPSITERLSQYYDVEMPELDQSVNRFENRFVVVRHKKMSKYQITELCKLGWKYGADKSPFICHAFTPYYYELLKDKRQTVKKVLELGVGNNTMVMYNKIDRNCPNAQIGASLKMWRDFFPNAWVYGADWCPESIIQDERLTTYYADLNKEEDILKLLEKTGTDLDLIIDDAGHRSAQQILLASTILPRLTSKSYIYVVEDCRQTRLVRYKLRKYNGFRPEFPTRNELNNQWGPMPHNRDEAVMFIGP